MTYLDILNWPLLRDIIIVIGSSKKHSLNGNMREIFTLPMQKVGVVKKMLHERKKTSRTCDVWRTTYVTYISESNVKLPAWRMIISQRVTVFKTLSLMIFCFFHSFVIHSQNKGCTLPAQTEDKSYAINCHEGVSKYKPSMVENKVNYFTTLTFTCHPGYTREKGNNIFNSYCLNGTWTPKIRDCKSML